MKQLKQFDYDTTNYKYKEDIKAFVQIMNDSMDKYVKGYETRDQDLNKVKAQIEKKTNSIEKLDVALADLSKKTDEFKALKATASSEIDELNVKKSEISYTDSEVQKMELDDINSQIAQKKNKISKVDSKLDSTKAKIKASTDEKKTYERELKDLEKDRMKEEEALYKAEAILSLVNELKDTLNSGVEDILTSSYKPVEVEVQEAPLKTEVVLKEIEPEERKEIEKEINPVNAPQEETKLEEAPITLDALSEIINEPIDEPILPEVEVEVSESVTEEPIKEEKLENNSLVEEAFKRENLDLDKFSNKEKERMFEDPERVINNLNVLKKHDVPLDYTEDQGEIFYDISTQDLDDLLSIITTDEDGNGMGFTIDFTYNVLNELSKINVDRLIDVYNSEFMNVNAKSGIIHLLKLTNPGLVDFEKNRRANIEILKSLGINTVDEIVSKYPDFVNMDNPLFINILNVFDKSDLIEKLNADVDVVPKLVEYWKNN